MQPTPPDSDRASRSLESSFCAVQSMKGALNGSNHPRSAGVRVRFRIDDGPACSSLGSSMHSSTNQSSALNDVPLNGGRYAFKQCMTGGTIYSNQECPPNAEDGKHSKNFEEAYKRASLENAHSTSVAGRNLEYHTSLQAGINNDLFDALELHETTLARRHEQLRKSALEHIDFLRKKNLDDVRMTEFERGYRSLEISSLTKLHALAQLPLQVPMDDLEVMLCLDDVDRNAVWDHVTKLRTFNKTAIAMSSNVKNQSSAKEELMSHTGKKSGASPLSSEIIQDDIPCTQDPKTASLMARGTARALDAYYSLKEGALRGLNELVGGDVLKALHSLHASACKDVMAVVRSELRNGLSSLRSLKGSIEEFLRELDTAFEQKDYATAEKMMFSCLETRRDILAVISARLDILRMCRSDIDTLESERTKVLNTTRETVHSCRTRRSDLLRRIEYDVDIIEQKTFNVKESLAQLLTTHTQYMEDADVRLTENTRETHRCLDEVQLLLERVHNLTDLRTKMIQDRIKEAERIARLRVEHLHHVQLLADHSAMLESGREKLRCALELTDLCDGFVQEASAYIASMDAEEEQRALLVEEAMRHYDEYHHLVQDCGMLVVKLESRKELLLQQARHYEFDAEKASDSLDTRREQYLEERDRCRTEAEKCALKISLIMTILDSGTEDFEKTFQEMIAWPECETCIQHHPLLEWKEEYAKQRKSIVQETYEYVVGEQSLIDASMRGIRVLGNAVEEQRLRDKSRPPEETPALIFAARHRTEST